jgi:LysR family nitrogen assimilation transcriptional regulator
MGRASVARARRKNSRMDIRQLKYFVAVVDLGSLSKASERLSISQPSLSQQVAGMEASLGTPLLLRSSSGMRPTEAGKTLYRHARTILRQFEQMRGEVTRGDRSEEGQVAVGLPTSAAAVLAVPLFIRLRERYPGIQLQLFESMSGYLIELLANGRLDMAVLFRDTETRGISVMPLRREELCVFGAAHVGDAQSPVCPLAALSGVPLVLPGGANGLRLLIERAFAQAGLDLNVVADIDSLPTMLKLASRGHAGTILSAALAHEVRAEPLLARRLVDPSITRPISLCLPNALPRNAASLAVQNTIVELVLELTDTWDTGPSLTGPAAPPRRGT